MGASRVVEIVGRVVGNKTYVLIESASATTAEIKAKVEDRIKDELQEAVNKIDEVASLLQIDLEDMFTTGSSFDEYQDLAAIIDDGRDNLMESLGIIISEPMLASSLDIGIERGYYIRNNEIKFYRVKVMVK